jgi:hypothetical protein
MNTTGNLNSQRKALGNLSNPKVDATNHILLKPHSNPEHFKTSKLFPESSNSRFIQDSQGDSENLEPFSQRFFSQKDPLPNALTLSQKYSSNPNTRKPLAEISIKENTPIDFSQLFKQTPKPSEKMIKPVTP